MIALIEIAQAGTDPLAQYGIIGAVFAAVFGGITVPIVRAMLKQNSDAIGLLREAVSANTKAVESFARYEQAQSIQNAQVTAKLDQVLAQQNHRAAG